MKKYIYILLVIIIMFSFAVQRLTDIVYNWFYTSNYYQERLHSYQEDTVNMVEALNQGGIQEMRLHIIGSFAHFDDKENIVIKPSATTTTEISFTMRKECSIIPQETEADWARGASIQIGSMNVPLTDEEKNTESTSTAFRFTRMLTAEDFVTYQVKCK